MAPIYIASHPGGRNRSLNCSLYLVMAVIGKFKITDSFKITGRDLVVIGDILEGKVKVGSFTTFNTGPKDITLKIGSVEMGDKMSSGEYFVGLLFAYKNEDEKKELKSLKLPEQIIDIVED